MAAQLRDAAVLNDGDPVRIAGTVESRWAMMMVGAAVGQLLKGLLELGLRHAVQGGGGLVQNQHRRVLQEDPGDGDALLLSAGEQGAPFPTLGVEPSGRGHDVVIDLRQLRRRGHLLLRGAGALP